MSGVLRRATVRFFTKPTCSLCVTAKQELDAFKAKSPVPFDVEMVDINLPANSKWFDKYQFDIPAAELDGEGIFIHRFNEESMMKRLRNWANSGKP